MRLMRRVDRHGKARRGKGECSHVWRTRNLVPVLSGSTCQVCEKCGVLHLMDAVTADSAG